MELDKPTWWDLGFRDDINYPHNYWKGYILGYIICAHSEQEARRFARDICEQSPYGTHGALGDKADGSRWLDPELTTCEKLINGISRGFDLDSTWVADTDNPLVQSLGFHP